MLKKISKTEQEWKKILSPEQYHMMRERGTERPFSCAWRKQDLGEGVFHCAACDLPLFSSEAKFESGTGWPSYFSPINPEHIEEFSDDSLGMHRIEVRCARCGSHLGHVFDDGPTGKRYCINSVALKFKPNDRKIANDRKLETIVLGGGCFWCLEAVYLHVKGVSKVICGYAGGKTTNPTYEQVSTGETGHAEVVQITFDPAIILYEDILHIFFTVHDPTTLNRQGNDIGTQYRSAILYANQQQHDLAEKIMREIAQEKIYTGLIVTELAPLETFYPAEEYHQNYYAKNPDQAYCQVVIAPKVAKFRQKYAKLYI